MEAVAASSLEDIEKKVTDLEFITKNHEIFITVIWLIFAGALVFFMDFGFAFLEAGNCSKNSLINVLVKNLIVFCIATIAFYILGFNLMFGDGVANFPSNVSYSCPLENQTPKLYSYIGNFNFTFDLPFPTLDKSKPPQDSQGKNPLGYPDQGFSCLKELWPNRSFAAIFFFQLVFAGAAATIISGAMAERLNFWAFCSFSFLFILIIYPVAGHWAWGLFGWLYQYGFRDFAGSTVVHSVGGTAALVGAWQQFSF
ncbi:MAG: ammonium transporter [Microcystis aeruginosa F13-15]|nr:ammonium transporter [Microcystis aeruginosa F13-15]